MFLEGIRVLDIGSYVAGPAAATVMADFGADVVKIEPLDGDPYRRLLGLVTMEYPNFFWDQDSRNKRSLAVDVTSEPGRDVLERLIAGADVLVTNYRTSLLERLKLTYDEVAALKPDIVYAQVNSFGLKGPDADRTGFDATAWWARSGLMDYVRRPESDPAISSPGMGDHPTCMALFGGIMGALYRREKTGQGAHVHTSLIANGAWAHSMLLQGALVGFDPTEARSADDLKNIPLATTYETADGRVLLLCILNADKEWPGFLRAIERTEWDDDPRFNDPMQRLMNGAALYEELAAVFAAQPAAHWKARLDAENITWQLAQTMSDVINDEQMHANDILTEVPPGRQLYAHTINSPIWIADDNKRTPGPAPHVGEHTVEVLQELGYDRAAIDAMLEAGVAVRSEES